MGIYDNWTYTDLHQLNLDWVIKIVKEYQIKYDKLEIDFVELKNFVNNYFDSVDFAQIVNDKIDELVNSGDFTTLFATYTTRIYDTVASMKADTLLVDGSKAHTLGYYAVMDGGGADYVISAITPSSYYEVLANGLNAQLIPGDSANILQYGAVNDGSFDNALKINTALTENDVVIIPDSTFASSGITVPSNKKILNNGDLIALATPLIIMNDGSAIIGGRYTTSLSNATAIQATNASKVTIKDVDISGFTNKGITLTDTINSIIDNVNVSGANGTTGGGISIAGNSYNNNVINCNVDNSRIGLIFQSSYMNNADNINIKNCPTMGVCFDGTISNSGDGAHDINISNITVTGQTNTSYGAIYAGNGSHNINIENAQLHSNALGIKTTASASNLITNLRINNVIITNSSNFGIQLSYGQHTHINNTVVDTAPTGITFYGADYGLLANSTISNCTTRGVMVQAGNCMVIANKLLNNNKGIEFAYGATSPVHNSMFNNLFVGNTTDATLGGSPVVANNVNYTP